MSSTSGASALLVTVVFVFLTQAHAWFYGLCYSPYSSMGVCRTAAELEEDVKLMLQHTNRVRLYSTECSEVMDGLLKKASHGQISLLLGLWIENSPRDMKELDQLIEHLKKYPNAALEGIVVGNEVLFRGQASPEYMGYLITETRNRVRGLGAALGSSVLSNVDIFTVEETPNPGVINQCDAVGVNIHPFYDWFDHPTRTTFDCSVYRTLNQMSDPEEYAHAAVERFTMKLNQHRSSFPGKKIVVTEVGWPTSSDMYNGDTQQGSDVMQLCFVKALLGVMASDPVPYYFFEFRNADWKRNGYNFKSGAYSEYNFGIFDSSNKPKMAAD